METGTIVTLNNIAFSDGVKDKKKNRPCIFLFKKEIDSKEYAYIIPLTSNVKRFNKDYNRYVFIPKKIYSERKLSFAKVDGIICVPLEQVISCEIRLDNRTMVQILSKIKHYAQTRNKTDKMEETIEELESKQYVLKSVKS